MVQHKVFISFYHQDDSKYKMYLDKLFFGKYINKSVKDGEYDSENSDEYIKRLIREDKISDSSVVIVLVGPKTKERKHVDWEIYAGLRASINGSSGLIGVLLPEFKLTDDGKYYISDIPARLGDNINSKYASMYTWNYFISDYSKIIESAFYSRVTKKHLIDNSRPQKKVNG